MYNNDNELLYLAQEHNEDAINILIKKYEPIILNIITQFELKYNLYGLEKSDLYQEALIGFMNAIKTFDKDKNILFYTYCIVCIRSSIYTQIRKSFREKNRVLNDSLPIDGLLDNDIINNSSYIYNDIDSVIIDKESEIEVLAKLKKVLTEKEKEILDLKVNGFNNIEISKLLDIDKKSIENSLFRIRNKYKKIK